jgi:hypothetical protein
MRKIVLIGTALVFALTSTAWAGAKDKSANTLVDRNATGVLDNTLAKTAVKSKGCKIQVKAKPVNLLDGEIVICILEADLVGGAEPGNSVLITGEAKKGGLKIKADISETTLLGQGCGDVDVVSFNGQIKCYLDDANYRSDAVAPGTWRQACDDEGSMIGGSAPTASTVGTTQLKANPGVPVVLGLCQGTVNGDRIGPPASAEWALTGQRTAIILP